MDYLMPVKLPKNYYVINFNKKSKNAYLSAILEKCSDKEDPEVCKQKYLKAFDSVFDTLNTKLQEEDRVANIFDDRLYNTLGLASYKTFYIQSGYENWESNRN
jgi:predicted RNase H-like nuclease (RuvC/YqgF family)